MPLTSQGSLAAEYEVEVSRDGGRLVECVLAGTPGLAATMVREMYPRCEVLRVTRTWTPRAVCKCCGVWIFEGDGHRRRTNGMCCWDCDT